MRQLLVSIVVIISAGAALSAKPYQLVESESATMIQQNHYEVKLNGFYETGYIPAGILRVGVRYGVIPRLEAYVQGEGGRFIEQDQTRLSSLSGTLKFHFWGRQFLQLNLFAYAKYKHMLGDAIIEPYESDNSSTRDVVETVSPHADEGRDASFGFLGRNSLNLGGSNYIYMVGLEYTMAMNRTYGDFEKYQHIGSAMFVPEYHFGDKLMAALENKFSYWFDRGYMYSVMPQIRWEFVSYWVLETGVVVPVIGAGNNYRIVLGCTYESR